MAQKLIFISRDNHSFEERLIDYTFVPGFATGQRKKNVINLKSSIRKEYPDSRILEVSTKSDNPLGVALSAFNLKLDNFYLESIFQSSKYFNDENQFDFLINEKPGYAKKYIKENAKFELKKFVYNGKSYPLDPPSFFYDYIYIKALYQNKTLSDQLINYDIFTDIEFNHNKSINCQARSCAIYVYLLKNNLVNEVINYPEKLIEVYKNKDYEGQISIFDF